jgi:hypothetical protein
MEIVNGVVVLKRVGRIRGAHSCSYEEFNLLGYNSV